MATHDYVISNGTGSAVRSDINGALAAIVSQNSNASEPATMYAYQWWADTTTGLLKIRNAANSAWVTIGTLASANLGLLPLAGGTMTGVLAVTAGTAALPGIAVSGDTNTGIYSPGADQVAISTGGTGRLFVQSDGDVCIGQSTGDSQLVVKGSTAARTVSQFIANDTSTTTMAVWERSDGAVSSRLIYDGVGLIKFGTSTSHALLFDTNNQTRMTILSGGNVGIGTTGPATNLEVSATSAEARITSTGGGNSARLTFVPGGESNPWYIYGLGRNLVFQDNATERARIDSSGRLLVGTSSARNLFFAGGASALTQIEGNSTATASLSITRNDASADGNALILAKARSTAYAIVQYVNGTTSDDRIGRISFQGADGTNMVPAASIEAYVDGTPGSNDMPGRLVFSTTADGASSPTERMRVDNQGRLFLATASTSPSTGLVIDTNSNGTFATNATNTAANWSHWSFKNSNGIVGQINTSGSATAYTTSSDYRLKENVVPLTNATDRLNQLQVHRFNFIADPGKTVDGFIAHEAQGVVPECVTGTKDEMDADGNPVYQGIDQSKLVPLLTAALQEAIARIETLEADVAALKGA